MLGDLELGVALEQLLGDLARALEQRRVVGQAGDLELRQPVLAGAEHLAGAAQLEVDLGQPKAIRVLGDRAQAGQAGISEEDAERRVLAATDAPAQLMELREPVALGGLDQHHRRVRHVDPDLDYGRRDEHVGLARCERAHRGGLLVRGHLAVYEPHLVPGQLARAQPLRLRGGRTRLERL